MLKLNSKGKSKEQTRLATGHFLGVADESLDIVIGTKEGTIKARDIRRMPVHSERWKPEELAAITGTL